MTTWATQKFTDAIVKNQISREHQINTSQIKKTGRIPVVDQGQDYIAGYSDEDGRVIKHDVPHIIFGDHTRIFKYVDFPYILGADGTKVLTPNTRLFNPKFLYYFFKNLNIPSRGYNRHFKILKEYEVVQPPLSEQQTIATILSKIQEAIENQNSIIKTTTELKAALMKKIFTEGLNGEPLKETEIGKIPTSWEVTTLEKVSQKLKAGGTPKTGNKNFWGGNVPLVKVEDVVNARKYLTKTNLNITEDGLNNSSAYLLPADSILFTMYGTAGEVTINTIPVAPTQNVLGIIKSDTVDTEFLYYALVFSRTNALEKIMDKTIFKHFTLAKAKQLLLPLPLMSEQQEIAKVFSAVDAKIENVKKLTSVKTDLFKSTLNNLMSGEIRVNNITL